MKAHLTPDWRGGVQEVYSFKTTIFTTRSGKEQRTAERVHPRRSVAFGGWVAGDQMRALQGVLYSRGAGVVDFADPARIGVPLLGDVPAGGTQLRLAFSPDWLGEEAQEICVSSYSDTAFGELLSSESVGAFGAAYSEDFNRSREPVLELSQPLTKAVRAGSIVRPVVSGHLSAQIDAQFRTNDVMEYSANVAVKVPDTQSHFVADYPMFDNRPLFVEKPNWAAPPSASFVTPYEQVDYGRGVTKEFLPVAFYTRTTQFDYLGSGRDQIGRIIAFFHAMRGRQGEFYAPTHTSDLRPAGPIRNGTSSIVVEGDAQKYRDSTVNGAIEIHVENGDVIRRQIVGMQAVGSGGAGAFAADYSDDFDTTRGGVFTRIDLDNPINRDVALRSIVMISWLLRCRFATDAITINWVTDDVARTTLQIMSLEKLD